MIDVQPGHSVWTAHVHLADGKIVEAQVQALEGDRDGAIHALGLRLGIPDFTDTSKVKMLMIQETDKDGKPVKTKDRRYVVHVYLSPRAADPKKVSLLSTSPIAALRAVRLMYGIPPDKKDTELGPWVVYEETSAGRFFRVGMQAHAFEDFSVAPKPEEQPKKTDSAEMELMSQDEDPPRKRYDLADDYDDDLPWDMHSHYSQTKYSDTYAPRQQEAGYSYTNNHRGYRERDWYGGAWNWRVDKKKEFITTMLNLMKEG